MTKAKGTFTIFADEREIIEKTRLVFVNLKRYGLFLHEVATIEPIENHGRRFALRMDIPFSWEGRGRFQSQLPKIVDEIDVPMMRKMTYDFQFDYTEENEKKSFRLFHNPKEKLKHSEIRLVRMNNEIIRKYMENKSPYDFFPLPFLHILMKLCRNMRKELKNI